MDKDIKLNVDWCTGETIDIRRQSHHQVKEDECAFHYLGTIKEYFPVYPTLNGPSAALRRTWTQGTVVSLSPSKGFPQCRGSVMSAPG